MRQLALQIQGDANPTLANFVSGHNAEALSALRAAAARQARESLLYLWGPGGSGKSHLLTGLAAALAQGGQPVRHLAGALASALDLAGPCLVVDDVHQLAPAAAEALFVAWNRVRDEGGLIACAGPVAPAALPLAPEVGSRLAWGEVYRLRPLDDQEKWAALRQRADELGMPIGNEVLDYLLKRARRDLPSLLHALARLDEASLESRRAITIPLVRELLEQQAGRDPLETLCD